MFYFAFLWTSLCNDIFRARVFVLLPKFSFGIYSSVLFFHQYYIDSRRFFEFSCNDIFVLVFFRYFRLELTVRCYFFIKISLFCVPFLHSFLETACCFDFVVSVLFDF